MHETFFTLLTNQESRNLGDIEASLDHDAAAGAPWYSQTLDQCNT